MKRIIQAVLCAVGAVVFGAGALTGVVYLFNATAYLAGFGEKVTVRIEESSTSGMSSGHAGIGTTLEDGRTVRLFDVTAGETVDARMVLIDIGKDTQAYTTAAAAAKDYIWIFGVVVLGAPALVFGFAAYVLSRGRPKPGSTTAEPTA
ncbi:hypothetical protein [Nocardia sp. NPDC050413]|uniref:hypothetical protein n=1 Tax=Nocardia sp. NPDC050413 TaxID=3155784 RepID=UPI003400B6EB